jgi:CubicO group peptidase (beta-lactamase class C family)
MLFEPGSRFQYNDGAFILLGLIVETVARLPFTSYVEEQVLARAGMADSGYFRLDRLPSRTAQHYVAGDSDQRDAEPTNIYSVPVIGGADGGAFATAADMARFWQALYSHRLLERATTDTLLHAHVEGIPSNRGAIGYGYGYGVWMMRSSRGTPIYYVEGWDPGVAFLSASYPEENLVITIIRNTDRTVWRIFDAVAPILEEAI